MIARCEALLTENPTPARAARLHYEIARLYELPLADSRRASNHYQQAFDRVPEHLPTIRGLRRTLIARRALRQAVALYDAEARLTADPNLKARILFAKGRLLEDGLALRGEAQKAYAQALDLSPADAVVLKALEQCAALADDWAELAHVLGKAANALEADGKQRAALLIQRAQVLETRLRDVEGAIAQYETALELDPEAEDAIEALKRLYYARGRHRDLVRILELGAGRSEDARLRTAALHTVSRLQADKLANRPEAISALERALYGAPQDRLLLEELAELKEAARDYRGLAKVLAQLVDALGAVPDRAGLLHRIGQIYDEHLGEPEQAQQWFARSLQVDPCYVPALQALGSFFASQGRWNELAQMHLAEAAATESTARRAAAHARVAEIVEKKLDDLEGAVDHHARALAVVPIYAPSFKALTRIFAHLKRSRDLVELYERAIELVEPERALTYLLKVGALYEDHLDEPAQAIHAYRRVLARDPKHLGAIHALQRAAESAERYRDLVEALVLEAELTTEKAHRVALLHRAAELIDEPLQDRDAALAMLKKVVALDPRYEPALTTLGRLYYHAGRWDDLLALYHAELAILGETPRAAQLLFKMAELAEHRLGRHQEATELYKRSVQIDPTSSTALRALARKLREQARWEELIDVLARDVKNHASPEERSAIHFRIGEAHEFKLGRAEAALEAYDKALNENEANLPAIEGRIRLRASRNESAKLAEELARALELTSEPPRRTALLMQLGEVLRDQQRDLRRAIACFEDVLSLDDGHHGALLALESLYRKTNQWQELGRVLRLQAQRLGDVESKTTALRELARIAARDEAARVSAADAYRELLALTPEDPEALTSFELIALEQQDTKALRVLDERIAVTTRDRALKAAHLTRLAESLETSDITRSLGLFRTALELEPDNLAAARGLSRLAAHSEDPTVLAQAARREAEVLGDKRAAAALYVRAGRASQDPTTAAASLERALELAPDNAAAASELRTTLKHTGEIERLSELLARAANSCADKDRAAILWRDVAMLYADEQGNLPGAIHALQRALKLAPDAPELTLALAELFARNGEWHEAARLFTRITERNTDRDLLLRAHRELARICEEKFQDSPAALPHLRAAAKLSPEDAELLEHLSELLSRTGQHAEAITVGQRLSELSRAPESKVSALLHLARIEQRRGDRGGAARALAEAVALEGPLAGAGAAMREAIGTWAEWTDYESALRRYLQSRVPARPAPTEAHVELARVQAEHLNQRQVALATLRAAVGQQPGNLLLRAKHAALLRETGALAECADQLRSLLLADVERAATWHDLAETFTAMDRPLARAAADDVLRILGYGARASAQGGNHELASSAGTWSSADVDDLARDLLPMGVTGELLGQLNEGLDKLYPPDLEAYGVSSRDRLSPRAGNPLRLLADRIAQQVGAGDFELYVHRSRARGAGVELESTPILIVPAWILEQSEAHQTFVLARMLVLRARNCHPLLKLTPRELEVSLAAYARTVSPNFGRGLTSEEVLEDQGRRLYRALSRKARKAAEEAAARYVGHGDGDVLSWVQSRERQATRFAALLCGDLAAALECLARSNGETREISLDLGDEATCDLLRFWVSEPAMRARGEGL